MLVFIIKDQNYISAYNKGINVSFTFQTIFTEPSCYRIVPEFTLSEAKDLIRAFLIMKDRVLTPLQHQVLIEGFKVAIFGCMLIYKCARVDWWMFES